MGKRIELSDLLTPQEHYFIGGTPPMEKVIRDSDYYIPVGLLNQNHEFTAEEIINKRSEIKTLTGFTINSVLENENQGLLLEDLDPLSLTTVRDPRVVDTTDPLLEPNNDLTIKFYRDFESIMKISGKPFEGRLRTSSKSGNPETE